MNFRNISVYITLASRGRCMRILSYIEKRGGPHFFARCLKRARYKNYLQSEAFSFHWGIYRKNREVHILLHDAWGV